MSNSQSQKAIALHHNQVDNARSRKLTKAKQRRYLFEMNRNGIKIRVETDKERLVLCILTFLLGVLLLLSVSFYFLWGIFVWLS